MTVDLYVGTLRDIYMIHEPNFQGGKVEIYRNWKFLTNFGII